MEIPIVFCANRAALQDNHERVLVWKVLNQPNNEAKINGL